MHSIFRPLRAALAVAALVAAALPGCIPYGYQPSIVRVPTLDSARKMEAHLSAGLPPSQTDGFYYGSLGINYALTNSVLFGVQTQGYTRYMPVWSELDDQPYLNYLRGGFSAGANVGVYRSRGRVRLYAQLGNDFETMHHQFHRVEANSVDVGYYRARGMYTKPWLQGSIVGSTKGRRPFWMEFFLGLRYSQFIRLSESYVADRLSTPVVPENFPMPSRMQSAVESTGGLSAHYKGISLALRLQFVYGPRPSTQYQRWWNTPRAPINLGLAYTFSTLGRG